MLSVRLSAAVRSVRDCGVWRVAALSHSTSTAAQADEVTKAKPFSEIPGPRGNSLVRLARFFVDYFRSQGKHHIWAQKMHAEYGPIVRQKFGAFECVLVADVGAIPDIFRQEGKYPRRIGFDLMHEQRRVGKRAEGVFLSEGEEWLRQRRVVNQHMMKIRAVESHIDDFSHVADDFVQRLARVRSPDSLTVAHLDNELFNWSLESASTFLLDERLGCLSDKRDPKTQEFIEAVHELSDVLGNVIFYPPKVVKALFPGAWKKFYNSSEVVFNNAEERIQKRLQQLGTQPRDEDAEVSFFEYLVRHPEMSKEQAVSNIAEFMSGAIDTTSNSVLFMLYELARNPDVQQKIFEEVTQAVRPGSEIEAHDLQQVPYLKAAIKETMRLYPITGGLNRVLPEDGVIMGYHVPKEVFLLASLYTMGRSESIFPEPETFRPERWLREREAGQDSRVSTFASLPFSFGPRMCVGRRIAEMEIQVLMVKLLSRFRVEAVSPLTGPMPMTTRLLLVPERPVEVSLVDRDSGQSQ